MNLGYKGRTLDSLSVKERKVAALRIHPYILFPNQEADRKCFQAALSAERQVKLLKKGDKAAAALLEEAEYFESVGGLQQLVAAESITTYRKARAEARKDISSVAHVAIYFHQAAKAIGRNATKNLVFELLADKDQVEAPNPSLILHHTKRGKLKAAWSDRATVAPVLAAIFMVVLERRASANPKPPMALVGANFERFVGLLRWYSTQLTETGSTKRKEAPITAKNGDIWTLPKRLTCSAGKPVPKGEPKPFSSLPDGDAAD